MSGFALFHRSLIGHPAFRNDSEAMAFAYLTLRASWKAARVRYKGKAISLERGQLAMSVRDFAEAMDRDKGWVERLLKRLRTDTMIETRSETGVMVITICNYEKYQAINEDRETANRTASETRTRHSRDTEQRTEQGKEEKVVARKRARTTDFEIPDWVPAEPWAAFCAMRQRKKAAVDSYIADRLFAKLEKIAAAGWDLAKVLDKATLNNWTDLYMPTAGRDDELRSAVPHQGQAADPEEFKAFCLRSADRSRQMGREQEAIDWEAKARGEEPRRNGTGPPRAIGTLLSFPQQATH